MQEVLLAVEIVIALALVGVILLQRSEGGALGMGGGPGGGGGAGLGGLLSARGAANILTRATAFLAVAFIGVSLALAVIAGKRDDGTSVFDNPDLAAPFTEDLATDDTLAAPEEGDDLPAPDEPAEDTGTEDGGE